MVLVGIMFSAVFAYAFTLPPDQTTNVIQPVNIGPDSQTKGGGFGTELFMKAGTSVALPGTPTWNKRGYIIGETNVVSPWVFFSNMSLPGKSSQLKIGSAGVNLQLPPVQPFSNDQTTPLIVDLQGRGSAVNDAQGREIMDLMVGTAAHATIKTNTSAVQLSSTRNSNGKSDIIARQIQLTEPNAGALKVLVATDTEGNAVWGTMEVVTNTDGTKRIQVNYPGSPVATAQNMCN